MFLNVAFETELSINDLYYHDCQTKLLWALSSDVSVNNSVANFVNIENDLVTMNDLPDISISNVSISSITTTTLELLLIYQNNVSLISNLSIFDINSTSMYLLKTHVDQALNIDVNNASQWMIFKYSDVLLLINSNLVDVD